MKYTEYSQRFIAKMLQDKKLEAEKQVAGFEELEQQKTKTIDFLESRRKQDEETYLKPILKQVEKQKKEMSDSLTEYKEALIEALHAFSVGLGTLSAQDLLKEYTHCKRVLKDELEDKSTLKEELQDIDKKAHCLFEHFLKTEDFESCVKFLKARVWSCDSKEELKKRKQEYSEYIKDFSKFEYTWKSDYIMRYSEYREDILKFMQLCGKLDARSFADEQMYYSEKIKDAIISGSVGEYGSLVSYLYCDDKFGHYERDRETLMYWHDKGFWEEKELLKSTEKQI